MREYLNGLDSPYTILSIPLLFETGQEKEVDRILLVDCPVELQVKRICSRDKISQQQARSIIATQCSRSRRLVGADEIIDNSGSLASLVPVIDKLDKRYLKLAH